MTINDLPHGQVIWHGYAIVGITGCTVDQRLATSEVVPVGGNPMDYDIVVTDDNKAILDAIATEQADD